MKEAPPDRSSSGRLELSRMLTAGADELAGALEARLEVVAAEPALAPTLRQALSRLVADEMGREALAGLTTVRVGAATSAAR